MISKRALRILKDAQYCEALKNKGLTMYLADVQALIDFIDKGGIPSSFEAPDSGF